MLRNLLEIKSISSIAGFKDYADNEAKRDAVGLDKDSNPGPGPDDFQLPSIRPGIELHARFLDE